MILLVAMAACSSSSAKADGSTVATGADTNGAAGPAAVTDSKLMITDSIPAGSVKVAVSTTAGDFEVLLYGDTPGHRDNFLKLVNNGDYEGLLFHRVVKDFMVQAGDPDSKDAPAGKHLGMGQVGENIPAEIVFPRHFHKRGALAAARSGDQVNPERKSSGSQFYIVTGKVYSDAEMDMLDGRLKRSVGQAHFNQLVKEHWSEIQEMRTNGDNEGLTKIQQQLSDQTNEWLEKNPVGMTPEMRAAYTTIGGAPHLDNEYTVYGEVISGMNTIDKIEEVSTDGNSRPLEDVKILSMKVIE